MNLADFGYHLPDELIAQAPCRERSRSRMMVIDRRASAVRHDRFDRLPTLLKEGDALVINDSKVIPARLTGKKETGGAIEILLLSRVSGETPLVQTWEVLLKPAKRLSVGARIAFGEGCEARVVERISDKKWLLEFTVTVPFPRFLEQYGKAPLPPYIKRGKGDAHAPEDDIRRYQTVYARQPGSIAAPTAGLHFTEEVMTALGERGVAIVPVTLHVGYGTFVPIETASVEDHVMEAEFYRIGEEAAARVNRAERVICVGTTSARVIEAAADGQGMVNPGAAWTRLYVYPGYRFRRVDALITNFHLPMSSLFLLVCALAGRDLMQSAYRQAVEERYRFYSYGDCMLIL
jgi:S-adenosylmethionine:tRNA ribosyltransferase-isomerase